MKKSRTVSIPLPNPPLRGRILYTGADMYKVSIWEGGKLMDTTQNTLRQRRCCGIWFSDSEASRDSPVIQYALTPFRHGGLRCAGLMEPCRAESREHEVRKSLQYVNKFSCPALLPSESRQLGLCCVCSVGDTYTNLLPTGTRKQQAMEKLGMLLWETTRASETEPRG